MIPRERGSDTSRVQIQGGPHDGATGRVVHTWHEDGRELVQVALDAGGVVNLELAPAAREAASVALLQLRTRGS